ncbi:MAG TPA: DUF1573 domain-containing protein [Tepidisphaeraceae bacterium]|nr:DUF1573 domain-containing protein [Tepidisphaeraceae bacterium]
MAFPKCPERPRQTEGFVEFQSSNSYRRKFAIAAGALAAASLLSAGAMRGIRSHKEAGLVCAESAYDFGNVSSSTAGLEHAFTLKNTTSHTIKITRTLTSCGCTTGILPRTTVAAGESLIFQVKTDWKGRDGRQTALVTLETDDSACHAVSLTVSASITNPVSVWPRVLDFGTLPPGLSMERSFEILPGTSDSPFRIVKVQATNPSIQFINASAPTDLQPSGGARKFTVKVLVPSRRGMVDGQIIITTSVADRPLIVSVVARSTGSITAAPTSVLFNAGDAAAAKTAKVRVHVRTNNHTFKLNAAIHSTTDDAVFSAEEVVSVAEPGGILATVTVHCNGSDHRLHVATLRVGGDADSIDIPLVVTGTKG